MASDGGTGSEDRAHSGRDILLDSIGELFELLLVEESLQSTVERIAALACRTIDGCAHASVTRPGPQGAYTAVSTSNVALEIDDAQYASARGPCIDAFTFQRPVRVASMSASGDYEEFRSAALARGVRSSFSLPLAVCERPVGALNLYSEATDGFGAVGDETAGYFAAQVAVAISWAELREQTRALVVNLEEALTSRDIIGQAKGIIMASHRVDADTAFAALRRASQHANRKLRAIAEDVVRTGSLPPE
jgi:GAF domain-containing protein